MTEELDPEITEMQEAFSRDYRLARRVMIVDGLEGYEVHVHTLDGVAPQSVYKTKEEAAARVLQLLGIREPITPQSWPERVEIGRIERPEPGEGR